jgi:hypothetical protein
VSNLDLNNLLEGWPHEPGQVKARKIVGNDGREKIQLRIDLGVIQMELDGRPDGQRPHGFDTVFSYYQAQADTAQKEGRPYRLEEQDLVALQQEGAQYYHRYLSLFQLKDFANVVRDTQRNLDVFDFVAEHCDEEEAKWAFEQYRPYLIMMNTRAKASMELQRANSSRAVELIQEGIHIIESFYEGIGQSEWIEGSNELGYLNEWLEEVRQHLPVSPLELMERDLQKAIENEAYERAAELRDAIRKLEEKDSGFL